MSNATSKTRVALLSIGDELLLGEIVDTNKPYIAQKLLPLGLTVVTAETAGDEMDDIVSAFKRALARADIVIATGGLGPTEDDLTFEALGKVMGVPLELHPEVLDAIAARFKRAALTLAPSNKKQALLPQGSNVLNNDWGTAPGLHYPTVDGKHVFLMPGVPREMRGLLNERIIPFLKTHFPSGQAVLIKTLHCFGTGESVIGERIKDLMQPGKNPDVGTRVNLGVVSVRLVAYGADEGQAQLTLRPALDHCRAVLADALFGEDDQTLSAATLKALLLKKKTVAVAESCTGGLVSAWLTDTPGASATLMEGAVVYSNEAKLRTCGVKAQTLAAHGAVSAETAAELAQGIRARAQTDIGLALTGVAGPGGGSEAKPVGLVYFALASDKGVQTLSRKFPYSERSVIRERAAMQALDLIRRAALD